MKCLKGSSSCVTFKRYIFAGDFTHCALITFTTLYFFGQPSISSLTVIKTDFLQQRQDKSPCVMCRTCSASTERAIFLPEVPPTHTHALHTHMQNRALTLMTYVHPGPKFSSVSMAGKSASRHKMLCCAGVSVCVWVSVCGTCIHKSRP